MLFSSPAGVESMRRMWVGTGWKMNKGFAEAEAYVLALREYLDAENPDANIFVVPPFTVLKSVCDIIKGSGLLVGGQNMHWEEAGSYTGEIAAPMLKESGVSLVELGHSERRAYFGETDYLVNKKVLSAIRFGLRPLVCVGETGIEKEFGVSGESVVRQVKIALYGVPEDRIAEVLIAYEPVWAIGDQGKPADPGYANGIHKLIRSVVSELYGERRAGEFPILYGGSVNLENAHDLIEQPDIDGLFIGRAAWDVDNFIKIIESIKGGIHS
jgi:L-erythrulose 1-phosphate isomerase